MAGRAWQPEALSTLYFLWAESKVSLLVSLLRPLPSNLPDLLPSLLPHFPFSGWWCRSFLLVAVSLAPQRLLLAASPVDTVVMSLSPGSTIGHPRPPQWAAISSLQRWGVGGWATAERWDGIKPSPRSAPLHAPAEVTDWGLVRENGAKVADFTHLPDSEPKPLCRSAPTDKLSDQRWKKVRTTTKDARFHLTRITHQRPCNKLNYNRILPLYYISRCITKTQAWGI